MHDTMLKPSLVRTENPNQILNVEYFLDIKQLYCEKIIWKDCEFECLLGKFSQIVCLFLKDLCNIYK